MTSMPFKRVLIGKRIMRRAAGKVLGKRKKIHMENPPKLV